MIPRRYPIEGERLDRVIHIPDIHVAPNGDTFGIVVAGGQDRLVGTLRIPLERLGANAFSGIGIVLDADNTATVGERFETFVEKLKVMNLDATSDGVPGFPLPLPTAPGIVTVGPPRMGVHIFPDNVRLGTLETILLECAASDHAILTRSAKLLVDYVDRKLPAGTSSLRRLRSASGRLKAHAGIVANVLQPGASLAVSIQTGGWLGPASIGNPCVVAADDFIIALS